MLHIHRVKCEDHCSFFTTPGWRCSVSLMMRRPDPCSLNTISRSRYSAPLRGWWPGSCPFNTIPRFRYGASLRELHPNNFPYDFISVEMAKIVVGSPSLTQSLLLYPGLGPAMLDNIGGVAYTLSLLTIFKILACLPWLSYRDNEKSIVKFYQS
jgi:hypothetical protein